MQSTSTLTRIGTARGQQVATRVVFFIIGCIPAVWAPLIPLAKARLGLDDGMLGLLLLCIGAGSIATMPLTGALASRVGCRLVVVMSALILFCTLPLLATIASVPWLVVALIFFGASLGSIDVAINIQAIAVEHQSGRAMMSGFHGFFSVGGVVGALSATALLSARVAPIWATVAVVLVLFLALLGVIAHLLADRSERTDSMFALPHGIVLLLGVLALIVFLSEGAVLDWSGVFLTSARDVSPSYAGLGYAAFAFTMTLGRLTGDRIVQALGAVKVVGLGGLLAALGFLIATYASPWILALVGYALVGAGCSNIVPVLMTSAGRQTVMSKNLAVSAVTTLGYLGILAGPACIGFIAHFLGLPAAFLILAILLLGVAVSSRFLSPNR